jgi:enoyl-CoA hydratase/carnithine racemase
MNKFVHGTRDGPILHLKLNDSATRNSLSSEMINELRSALGSAESDLTVAAVVLSASGPVFCSGHNLKELTAHRSDADGGRKYFEGVFGACSDMMLKIAVHRCPVIAEVDGLASAAGCQLVATCDLAYASPRASFCTPGVNIGLFCSTPMVALSRVVPSKHAMEMLLTGEVYDAAFAERVGLINQVVAQNTLSTFVAEKAKHIASKSRAAIAVGKNLFHVQRFLAPKAAYELAAASMAENSMEAAACEGIDAFLQKRPPNWPKLK